MTPGMSRTWRAFLVTFLPVIAFWVVVVVLLTLS